MPDQYVPDQYVPDQYVPDQYVPDQYVPDQYVPDQYVPDQAVPDQAVSPQDQQVRDQQLATCAAKYGSVPNFKLCASSLKACIFFFRVAGSENCDKLCGDRGGTCISSAAEDNDSCRVSSVTKCDFKHYDGLCTCTR